MHFDLTEEQKSLQIMLDAFCRDRFGGAEGVRAIEQIALDRTLWRAIAELGLGGALVPESHGGLGAGLLTAAVVAETLGRHAVPAPVIQNLLAAWLIATAGDDAQRERWLASLIRGDAIATFALAEDGGWLANTWTIQGDRLSGIKRYVERAGEADMLIVGMKGGGLALVETGGEGIAIDPVDTLDRTRPLYDVRLDGVPGERLGADGAVVERLLDALLICHAADGLGAACAAQMRAVGYALERKQFGQLIGSFQALKHQLADMSVELEPARPLYWYAAHAWDTGRPDAHRMAALAKAHIGDISVNAARAAIEAHGGIGYTWEYPVHLFLKRAMHDRTVMGGPSFHRARMAEFAGW